MKNQLALRAQTVFGLAFDVEKADTNSGFKPADVNYGGDMPLFGSLRLEGFAAMLKAGYSNRLALVGGDEGRYRGENSRVNRAIAIRKMLIREFGIAEDLVDATPSGPNTISNISVVKQIVKREKLTATACAVVSSYYHLPRVHLDLAAADLHVQIVPAEAFILLANPERESELFKQFGGNGFGKRVVGELKLIADKIRGTYRPMQIVR